MAFRFESLDIWKSAGGYGSTLYDVAETFPKNEMFAMGDQLRRAALSISNNIAEGSGSASNKDFINFLNIAIKSAFETVSILYMAKKRGYITLAQRQKLYAQAEILVKKIQAFKKTL